MLHIDDGGEVGERCNISHEIDRMITHSGRKKIKAVAIAFSFTDAKAA